MPGGVGLYYGGGFRKVKTAEVFLRGLICVLGVVAAVVVATDSEIRNIFSVERKAKFTNLKSLVFLFVANVIAAGYSLVQFFHCVVSLSTGSQLFNKPLGWIVFSFDQLMAYVTLAAFAAAAQTAIFAEKGESELQWMKLCSMYVKFCFRLGEGMISAMLVSFSFVALSCMSAFNLFRLYGKIRPVNHCSYLHHQSTNPAIITSELNVL